MSDPVQRFLTVLRDHGHEPRKAGTGWCCRCPAHDDRNPSLSIHAGDDGRALVNCHAGCTVDAVCGSIGLRPADLFAPDPRNGRTPRTRPIVTVTKTPRKPAPKGGNGDGDAKTFPTARDAVAELERRNGPRSATWTYHDAGGEPVGFVVRWDTPSGKDVRPVSRKADGTGWVIRKVQGRHPLYRLPDLLATPAGSRVWVCEGEKATDAARAVGLVTTTSAGGAERAKGSDWSPVAGRDVVILPDHDDAGERYAADVARLATAAGAKSVRVVRLVQLWAGMPEGGDMADLVQHRGGDVDPIRLEVEALADTSDPDAVTPDAPAFAPIAASDLIREYRDLRPVVIADLLREGETMNVVAAPKVGKSWLIHALAVAVVSGRDWLGKATTRGRVLLIDGELHRETLARRLRATQTTMGVSDADMARLQVWAVRGQRLTIDAIADALQHLPAGEYRLIILDALYRFLPLDGEENANETMTRVYNTLDGIAKRAGASIAVVHHATKGNQSDKAVTDVGAGAGSQSRAADTHLILRPHEADDAVVVDAVVRSFPPMDSFVIKSMNPGWVLALELDPALLRKPARRGKADRAMPVLEPIRVWTPDDFASEIVGRERFIRDDVIAQAVSKGLGKGEAESLLRRAMEAGKVHRHRDGPSAPHRFSIEPPPSPGREGGTVGASPAPSADALGGVGGCARPPSPLRG